MNSFEITTRVTIALKPGWHVEGDEAVRNDDPSVRESLNAYDVMTEIKKCIVLPRDDADQGWEVIGTVMVD